MSSRERPSRATRRLLTGLVDLSVVFGVGAGVQAAPDKRGHESPKPTVVLVHGGWDNSSGWDAVVEKLQTTDRTPVSEGP